MWLWQQNASSILAPPISLALFKAMKITTYPFFEYQMICGDIRIEVYRGKLRLRLPRKLFDGKQKVIYTKLPDTQLGWRKAQQQAWEIEDDIRSDRLDTSLSKYKPTCRLSVVSTQPKPSLLDLWDAYCDYRRPQISVTHFRENYQRRYRNAILELPTREISDAIAIRDYLLKNKSPGTAKQLLIQFNAAAKYGVKSQLIAHNPFEGLASDIRVKSKHYEDIDPFTPAERDAIVKAFEDHPRHQRYAGFVKFLFLTGCRTSEAVGVRWGDINAECTQIVFSSVISKKQRKGTKNNRVRKFPCNQTLQALLLSIRPSSPDLDELVFKNPQGNPINPSTFIHNAWGGDRAKGKVGIVTKLVEEGLVERYRPQYNTRHTFITTCLEQAISLPQIARWVGNSPGTLLAYYGGVICRMRPPEF